MKESNLSLKEIYNSILENKDYLIEHVGNDSDANIPSKISSIFSIATKKSKYISYAGSYEIRNKETNKVYIGESINLCDRFSKHISDLYNNTHHCKTLQELFNETKDIANFRITPLFMFKVVSNDKKVVKEETLYLESAFYLIAKYNHEEILNTLNPYLELKHGNVHLDDYEINCKNVLTLLYEDKYDVLPNNIKKLVRNNLHDFVGIVEKEEDTITDNNVCELNSSNQRSLKEKSIEEKKIKKAPVDGLFRISTILNECKETGVLPKNADYQKIRKILEEHNFIYIDEYGHTIATEYALTNKFYIISDIKMIKGKEIPNYYITLEGKNLIIEIFKNYPSKNYL